jgi:hypothetical protein
MPTSPALSLRRRTYLDKLPHLVWGLSRTQMTRVLERLIGECGRPENVRSDNRPEFTSRRMLGWAEDWKVGLVHIQPGRPMQNDSGNLARRVQLRGIEELDPTLSARSENAFIIVATL